LKVFGWEANDLLAYDIITDPDDYSNGVHLHLHVG